MHICTLRLTSRTGTNLTLSLPTHSLSAGMRHVASYLSKENTATFILYLVGWCAVRGYNWLNRETRGAYISMASILASMEAMPCMTASLQETQGSVDYFFGFFHFSFFSWFSAKSWISIKTAIYGSTSDNFRLTRTGCGRQPEGTRMVSGACPKALSRALVRRHSGVFGWARSLCPCRGLRSFPSRQQKTFWKFHQIPRTCSLAD